MIKPEKTVRERLRTRVGQDRGAVAIVVVMMLVPVLIGSAALGVDVSSWYVAGARMQKAADAGALAGVIHMPGDLTLATAAATAAVNRNGFTVAANCAASGAPASCVQITTSAGSRSSQLRVTLSATVNNFFGPILGTPKQGLVRDAVADYQGPAPMGSPCNVLGNEDMETTGKWASANCDSQDDTYWLESAGKNLNKVQGDAFQAGWCSVPQAGGTIDGCSSISSGTPKGVNAEYNPDGYFYSVRASSAGLLTLQGYDIAYAKTGQSCGSFGGAPSTTNEFVTTTAEAQKRYAGGGTAYCSGDTGFSGNEGDDTPVPVTVTIRGQSPDAWNPKAGPILCQRTWTGFGSSAVSAAALGSNTAANKDLRESFHRWANLTTGTGVGCSSAGLNVTAGDYSVEISNGGLGGGENVFGLRAQLNGSITASTAVSIFAAGRVALFNNILGSPQFHLVRLDSGTAGHELELSFFDLGDSTGGTFDIRVLQPDSSNLAASNTFANCRFSGVYNYAPTGNTNPDNCKIIGASSSSYGGHWQKVTVSIPANYVCNQNTNQSKCWVRIQMVNNTSNPHDVTTWRADFSGDPVRIVE